MSTAPISFSAFAEAVPAGPRAAGHRSSLISELPIRTDGASPEQARLLKTFDTGEPAFTVTSFDEPDGDDPWRLTRVTFRSPIDTPWPENNVVPCELYLPKEKTVGPLPAVIVLDILHGSAFIPRAIARGLAEKGAVAIYVPMACYGVRQPANDAHIRYFHEHPDKTVDNVRQTVMDVRRAKAFLATLPMVDSSRVSITGVSLGGIMASLIAGVDGSFYRVAPILAGGDLAAICFHARETRRIREACIEKGITEETLRAMLKPVEPLTYADRIRDDGCLIIRATEDEVIPPESTAELAKTIGNPTVIELPATHYSAAFFLPTLRARLADFFLGKEFEPVQ